MMQIRIGPFYHLQNTVKFVEIVKSINGHKADIDSSVLKDMDVMITAIFTIIRYNNSVGHPTGSIIEKDELSAWISVYQFFYS